MKVFQVQLLGDFRIAYGDELVTTVRSPRLQSLLAYLALHREAPQSRYHVAFTFWPDSTEALALSNLRKSIFRLRRALPDADSFLQVDDQIVQWRQDGPYDLDVATFESALTQADQAEQAGDHERAREALSAALSVYGGDLLPSCYDDWILPVREQLRQAFVGATERLTRTLEAQRDYPQAIAHTRYLLHLDPLREATYRALIRLYALDGDRASALRTYHTCVTVLRRELDVEPSPDTQEVYQRLLRMEVSPTPAQLPPTAGRAEGALVGRHHEWSQLRTAWQEASTGQPRLMLLRGEAGIGKTRLAEELLRWVTQQGMAAASARCYAAEGELAYAPLVSWLRARPLAPLDPLWRSELARLLPELLTQQPDLPPPRAMTEPWQRQRLFEALARALLGGGQPLLLLLDDLQWCDPETLACLHYLLRFDPSARLLLLATARTEELGIEHPARPWLAALEREGRLTEVELRRLDEGETLALAQEVAGGVLGPDLAACLYAETEGNPLFVVELVRAARVPGELGPGCPPQGIPPRMQATIEARLAELSPPARELAGLAATVGRAFTFPVLAQASSLEEDALIRALDELWGRRVVREQGGEGYDFAHDKIRDVAYAAMSPVRQRASHRRVAQALERMHRADPDPVSAQIGAHYERGGEGEKAIPHYLRAGEVAQRVYANEEAVGHYQRALALVADSSGPQAGQWQFEALDGLGQLQLRIGELDRAGRSLEEAISLGQRIGLLPPQVVRALWWLGRVRYEQVRFGEMIPIAERGLALLGDDVESLEAALMNETLASGHGAEGFIDYNYRNAAFVGRLPYSESLGRIYGRIIEAYMRDKRADDASEWVRKLEQEASAHDDADALGNAHSYAGRILANAGDLSGTVARLAAGVEVARRTGDVDRQSHRSRQLGFTHLRLGDLDRAEELARAMLDMVRGGRLRRHTGWGSSLLAEVLLCRGLAREARDLLEEDLPLLRQVGLHEETILHESLLGRAYLALGEHEGARQHFASSLDLIWSAGSQNWHWWARLAYPLILARALGGLERAYLDPEAFRRHCRRLQQRFSGVSLSRLRGQSPFHHWFLAPADVEGYPHAVWGGAGLGAMAALDWAWHDPFGDCSSTVAEGIEICAANGRDLWFSNVSAPRLLLPAPHRTGGGSGALAIEVVCEPVSDEKPAIGGLLLWSDQENYLRLDLGSGGPGDVTLLGCVDDEDQFIGRGCLSACCREGTYDRHATPVFLRLERSGDRVRGLCSVDGRRWFSVGQTSFPTAGSAQVGVYAIGNIDRTVYHGTYPDGGAIRFRSFQLRDG